MINTDYKRNTARRLLYDIESVCEDKQAENRIKLASVAEMVAAVEPFMPSPPRYVTKNRAANLRRSVSSSCPACVRPDRMADWCESLRTELREYARKIRTALGEEIETNVHDLKSNI